MTDSMDEIKRLLSYKENELTGLRFRFKQLKEQSQELETFLETDNTEKSHNMFKIHEINQQNQQEILRKLEQIDLDIRKMGLEIEKMKDQETNLRKELEEAKRRGFELQELNRRLYKNLSEKNEDFGLLASICEAEALKNTKTVEDLRLLRLHIIREVKNIKDFSDVFWRKYNEILQKQQKQAKILEKEADFEPEVAKSELFSRNTSNLGFDFMSQSIAEYFPKPERPLEDLRLDFGKESRKKELPKPKCYLISGIKEKRLQFGILEALFAVIRGNISEIYKNYHFELKFDSMENGAKSNKPFTISFEYLCENEVFVKFEAIYQELKRNFLLKDQENRVFIYYFKYEIYKKTKNEFSDRNYRVYYVITSNKRPGIRNAGRRELINEVVFLRNPPVIKDIQTMSLENLFKLDIEFFLSLSQELESLPGCLDLLELMTALQRDKPEPLLESLSLENRSQKLDMKGYLHQIQKFLKNNSKTLENKAKNEKNEENKEKDEKSLEDEKKGLFFSKN